jgi:hypothetical protein
MRWIKKDKNKISRGETNAPDGDCYFVDGKGSMAIVDNTLYIDGKKAKQKQTITMKDADIDIDVDDNGKVKSKKVNKHGK